MKESAIKNCTNPKNIFNSTNQEACLIARRLRGFGWKNIRYWFKPIDIMNVILLPVDGKVNEEEVFETSMFMEDGILFETPMNHYLTARSGEKTFLINAGYIGRHFFISEKAAFRELKRLIDHALNNELPKLEELSSPTE